MIVQNFRKITRKPISIRGNSLIIADGELLRIRLSNGEWAVTDTSVFDLVKDKWWVAQPGNAGYVYAKAWLPRCGEPKIHVLMHRLVTKCSPGLVVDHINGDSLDNRLSNLRVCTYSQNNSHRVRMPPQNTSGVIGVSWDKRQEQWIARIRHHKKDFHLGSFNKFDEAVAKRKAAELRYFGEFRPDAERAA